MRTFASTDSDPTQNEHSFRIKSKVVFKINKTVF